MINSNQRNFLDLAIRSKVLRFGEFTLKSGRISPYFFNAGLFNSGHSLKLLGEFFANRIVESGIAFDMLYGPAYKGIPLATTIAIALADQHDRDVPVCFNRKEAKDHGEGGNLIGAALEGRVLIVDDVISAGTSIRESFDIIDQHPAEATAVCIALDRQEKGLSSLSASQEVSERYGVPVISIAGLDSLMTYTGDSDDPQIKSSLMAITDYRNRYGAGLD